MSTLQFLVPTLPVASSHPGFRLLLEPTRAPCWAPLDAKERSILASIFAAYGIEVVFYALDCKGARDQLDRLPQQGRKVLLMTDSLPSLRQFLGKDIRCLDLDAVQLMLNLGPHSSSDNILRAQTIMAALIAPPPWEQSDSAESTPASNPVIPPRTHSRKPSKIVKDKEPRYKSRARMLGLRVEIGLPRADKLRKLQMMQLAHLHQMQTGGGNGVSVTA